MKKVILAVLLTVVVVAVALWLGLLIVARSGAVNVAASAGYLPGVERFFSTLSESSIRRQAQRAVDKGTIRPPAESTLRSEAMVRIGGSHYRSMCVVCHGAPGVDPSAIGKGMKPKPPDLAHVAREMSPSEIHWVLTHGIRHTGMPAFGLTHSPRDLWAITAFVERLEGMAPQEYRRWTEGGGADGPAAAEGGHTHQH